ncbi:ATP-dependent DNA helicase [Skermania piniformis]
MIRRPVGPVAGREWADDARALLDGRFSVGPGWRPWQVLGGPGTGKTALLTDFATARIAAGADPESVLVLTHTKPAAAALRNAISSGLAAVGGVPGATREPLVRTLHSYAFAVLRVHAAAHQNPPPRLLTGADQDATVRELLLGELDDGAADWPARLRPALATDGFVTELRDLLLRAEERGIGPEDLVRLGRAHGRPEWTAAGRFGLRYEQIQLLRWSVGVEAPEATAPALDAAHLVGAALTALATDDGLLARERDRLRYVLVDDAHHLDPQAARLVRMIGTHTDATVVAGDPDQAVFTFRGADPGFLTGLSDAEPAPVRRVLLRRNHRAGEQIGVLVNRIAGRLPGLPPHRGATPTGPAGEVAVRVLPSVAAEAAAVADHLRRAHLERGVPWSRMAVLVRSVPLSVVALRRALTAAGVPVTTVTSTVPLARRSGAAWLLAALRAAAGEIAPDDASTLLTGPLGRADPVMMRRLRRGLRRAAPAGGRERDTTEVLCSLLSGADALMLAELTEVEAAPVRRVLRVLDAGRAAVADGAGVEYVAWVAWRASRLERRWVAASARGGPLGVQADHDLDAIIGLFEVAAEYVDQLPGAGGVLGFVAHVERQRLGAPAVRRIAEHSVGIVSAHAAAGREWDVVAVAGLQEGLWPGLGPRGSLLRAGELVDLAAGMEPSAERRGVTATLVAEERRLLLVASSRARRSLLLTAVESTTGDRDLVPSRFVEELVGIDAQSAEVRTGPPRTLALPALVAELRSAVCDPDCPPERRSRAARQLARLARAGVRGADPDEWYGLSAPSSDAPLRIAGAEPVALSPSVVEQLLTCPLRWALERHGGDDGPNIHALEGNVVHTLVQAIAGRMSDEQVRAALAAAWQDVDLGSGWYARRELRRTETMLDNFVAWLRTSRHELTQAGVEVAVDVRLPSRAPDESDVQLRGRIDRLERDPDGRLVIVDVKTGKTPISKQLAQDHPQLAAYQVAAAEGGISGERPGEPGGGRLVYVAKSHNKDGATQRFQAPLDAEALDRWRDTIHRAAAATRGPDYLAIRNDTCRHCPVAGSCPAQDAGRSVASG